MRLLFSYSILEIVAEVTTKEQDVLEQDAASGGGGHDDEKSYALSRPLIITALILATALSALDGTIVATAMPTIVGALGGLPLYSLVVAAYLLTATTTVPLYGKLSDMYGRKPIFLVGAGLFIVGSMLCGLAWDMPSLIVFRAVQGLGAGAVVPVSLTLVGDLFSLEERARLQGVFSAVWGVSSVVGPLVGGAIVQYFEWPWVFFINIPVGILSALLLFVYLREPSIHHRARVDVAGAVTLNIGLAALLIGLQSAGHGGWTSPTTLGFIALAVALLAIFGLVERRAAAPILSLEMLMRPIISIPCVVGMLTGAVLVGFAAYSPLIIQGAWGGTPIEAGLLIAPLSIGWPIGSSTSGRLFKRFGFFKVVLGGALTILLGCVLFMICFLPVVSSQPILRSAAVLLGTFVTGLGFGYNTTSTLIAAQNSVPWGERGIATASLQFFRNMGNAVGAPVLGAILTATLTATLSDTAIQGMLKELPAGAAGAGSDEALGPVNILFDLKVRDLLGRAVRDVLENALLGSLGWVFVCVLVFAALAAFLAVRFPRKVATS